MKRGRRPRKSKQGFTLIEMLVVLIIVGLVSGILLQTLGQVFRLQRHFGSELGKTQQGAMVADWFRQTVEGLQPDYIDGKNKFTGTERRFTGMTTNPLSADYGAPAAFGFELVYNPNKDETELRYGLEKNAPVIAAWQGNLGKVGYVDAKGEPHDTWPPPLGQWPQLPAAIRLEAMREGSPWVIIAVPMGPADPLPRVGDFFGMRQ